MEKKNLEMGIELLKEATKKDEKGDLENAYRLYKEAIFHLMNSLKS